jgi:hypothetical protein
VQINSIGGDPQDAIKSGTFAPGKIGDPTAKGNSCDDQNDPVGCIFTQNLLVPDVTAAEITAAYVPLGRGLMTGFQGPVGAVTIRTMKLTVEETKITKRPTPHQPQTPRMAVTIRMMKMTVEETKKMNKLPLHQHLNPHHQPPQHQPPAPPTTAEKTTRKTQIPEKVSKTPPRTPPSN